MPDWLFLFATWIVVIEMLISNSAAIKLLLREEKCNVDLDYYNFRHWLKVFVYIIYRIVLLIRGVKYIYQIVLLDKFDWST